MQKKLFVVTSLIFAISLVLGLASPSAAVAARGQDKNAKGRQLFITYCASCHGVDGKGGGPAASALKNSLPDLTRLARQDGKFPRLHIQRIISGDDVITGHGSREMPVWGRYFREKRDGTIAQINLYALTRYLESIQTE